MDRKTPRTLAIRLAGLAGLAVTLSGCYSHHADHRETISASAGDAQAINRIVQMKDPWPPGAWDKSIDHDGTRMVNAIDNYHRPKRESDPNAEALSDLVSGPTTLGQ